jgi:hypothetical protein
MENLEEKYKHIKGWGIDADPENEPTYPMKKWTGDDHNRLDYERPPQQPVNIELLKSNERPTVSAVFGTSTPPKGLSGTLRRKAFQYSEGEWRHWLILVLADRVNMLEGIAEDLAHGHVPNVVKERGWPAEWEHNKKSMATKIAVGAAISLTVVALLSQRKKKKSRKAMA